MTLYSVSPRRMAKARGGDANAELEDFNPRKLGDSEVAELVNDDEGEKDGDEEERRGDKAGAVLPDEDGGGGEDGEEVARG